MDIIRNNVCRFVHTTIRGFDKPEFIDLTVTCQGRNQTDIRTFRRFDGAHTAIVRMMYVANFKARAFTRQAAGAEGTETTLVCQFG